MNKGITLESAKTALGNFAAAGIMVHSYLMYGFPTQTERELEGALRYVRDRFREGTIQSAFFHRFALTVHSPIARDPAKYGIKLVEGEKGGRMEGWKGGWVDGWKGVAFDLTASQPSHLPPSSSSTLSRGRRFALNEIGYVEEGAPDWSHYARPLEVALYNYMLGLGLNRTPRFFLEYAG